MFYHFDAIVSGDADAKTAARKAGKTIPEILHTPRPGIAAFLQQCWRNKHLRGA